VSDSEKPVKRRIAPAHILLVVDLTATVFLGIQGGLAASGSSLDLFGVMVLSFATALGGGVIRDLLIGEAPPAAIRDARYPIAAFTGGAIAFLLYQTVRAAPNSIVTVVDAAGLGLFAVSGAAKALNYKIGPFLSVLMGTITGVGGGTIRDLFLMKIPGILRADIYAVAALTGAAVFVIGLRLGMPKTAAMFVGAVVCFSLRLVAVWQHWNLPRIGSL
jgi:uncharacterized membrane protein YeiH